MTSTMPCSQAPSDRSGRLVEIDGLAKKANVRIDESITLLLTRDPDEQTLLSRTSIGIAGEAISAALCEAPTDVSLLSALQDLKQAAAAITSAYAQDEGRPMQQPSLRRILDLIEGIGRHRRLTFTTSEGDVATGTLRRFEVPRLSAACTFGHYVLWIEPSRPLDGLNMCMVWIDERVWYSGSAGVPGRPMGRMRQTRASRRQRAPSTMRRSTQRGRVQCE